MKYNKSVHESELLREALLDLERSTQKEEELRNELKIILEGLDVITDFSKKQNLFQNLLSLLKKSINFDHAFILTVDPDEQQASVTYSYSEEFKDQVFKMGKTFGRVLEGQLINSFDVKFIDEWMQLSLLSRVRSALHVPLRNDNHPAIMIITHSEVGFFKAPDVGLVRKFSLLTSHALVQFNNQQHLKEINFSLEQQIMEKIKAQMIIEQQQAKLAYSSKMAALGEMAAGMSHEINNPLTIICGASANLERILAQPEINKENALIMSKKIETTTYRIARIIKGLRNFSRDGSADPLLKVDLVKMIHETLEFCNVKIHSSNVQIKAHLPESFPLARARASEVSQVLINLMNNSFDAVVEMSDPWISIRLEEADDHLSIVVSDSGSGLGPLVEEKIFQPFFTTKDVGKGTGLGLSISKAIMKNQGGDLNYVSGCSNTTFIISLQKAT